MLKRFSSSYELQGWRQVEAFQFMTDACIPAVVEWILRYFKVAGIVYHHAPFTDLFKFEWPEGMPIPIIKVSRQQFQLYGDMKPQASGDSPTYPADFGGAAEYLQEYFGREVRTEIRNAQHFPKSKAGGFAKVREVEHAVRFGQVAVLSISRPLHETGSKVNTSHALAVVGIDPPDLLVYDVARSHSSQPLRLTITEVIRLHHESDEGRGEDLLLVENRGDPIYV